MRREVLLQVRDYAGEGGAMRKSNIKLTICSLILEAQHVDVAKVTTGVSHAIVLSFQIKLSPL